jgi:hypothetical protein
MKALSIKQPFSFLIIDRSTILDKITTMLTQKQRAILNYLKDGQKKKSQIVNRFKSWHYANSSKYIGEILSRMVERSIIIRVEKGIYALNTHLETKESKSEDINGQASLF